MSNFIFTLNPIMQALIATIFTWGVTALGAALVFAFKTIHKNILDGMLGIAAGVMIAASFWSLLSPSILMATNLNMNVMVVVSAGFLAGGLLLFIGDKIMNRMSLNSLNNKSKRIIMLITSITLHNIPEGMYNLIHINFNMIISFNFNTFNNTRP